MALIPIATLPNFSAVYEDNTKEALREINMLPNSKISNVNFAMEGASSRIFSHSAIFSSHHANWTDIYLEYHLQPAQDTGDFSSPLPYLSTSLTNSNPAERWLDGHLYQQLIFSGDTIVIPAEAVHRCQWQKEGLFIIVSFEPVFLEQIEQELVNVDPLQITPHVELRDSFIKGMLLALKDELQQELTTGWIGDNLYVEKLKTALAFHLLRKYTSHQPIIRDYPNGLSRYKLKQALEYIHTNLNENIKIVDIAEMLNMSQFYFSRLFRQSTGVSPYQYVIQQRVKKAQKLLKQQRELSIADIALECGFNHQSHLAKYFRQFTKTTPKKYRNRV
ncbi:MAG: helix-turn-helix domain-containing protein [Xenococcaceae cyanobacterium]